MTFLEAVGGSTAITAFIQLSGFTVAYILQTEVFYDILGGTNFLVLGIYSSETHSFQKEEGDHHPFWSDKRKLYATIIFSLSRFWLLLFLAWRAHERGGDSRFDEVKTQFGRFLLFWVVQGIWVLSISLPIIFINSSHVWDPELNGWEYTFLIGFGLGVAIEVIADVQKAIWVKLGRREGGFCRRGLWYFSRHPNYFGEMLQWWMVFLYSFGSGSGWSDGGWWVGIISPLFTMKILLNTPATGVMQANGKNLKRYYDVYPEEYAEYRKNTSILLPMVGYRYVPMFLKRTLFFDFEMYEYKPQRETKSDDPKSQSLTAAAAEDSSTYRAIS